MELRHFRCFIAAAETLHFARAAEQLGISPPALTRQIQDIEQALQVRLFERTKRSVVLTSAGEVLLEEARRTVQQAARAEEAARRAGRGETGRIEIGYVASAAYAGLLQAEIARFRASHPQVLLNLSEAAMDRLPALVAGGSLDLAFIRPPIACPETIMTIDLLSERFVAALPQQSLLAQQASILPARLAGELFIMPEQVAGTEEVARRGRFTPRTGPSPGGLVAVIALVSMGVGIAIVPSSGIGRIDMPGVVYREIEGKRITTAIALACRRHEKSPVVKAFINQIAKAKTKNKEQK